MLQIPLPEVRRTEALESVSEQKQKIRAVKGDLVASDDNRVKCFLRPGPERPDDGGWNGSDGLPH